MPRAAQAKPNKLAVRKKAKNETARFEILAKLAHENVEKYNKVINTTKAYEGNIRRGRRFLEDQVAARKDAGITICEQGIPTDELEKAFDNPPNQYSAIVTEMFMTQKCFEENCKKGVAEGIHAAFCKYWDQMDGDKYAGEYILNPVTKQVSGCPARAPNVIAVKKAVQTRGKAQSASRKHAEALSIEDEQKLMRWSEQECSHVQLESIESRTTGLGNNRPFDKESSNKEPLTVQEVLVLFEHGFMRAFVTSAYTLWTRCFELLSLTYGDIKPDCRGRAPYYPPHFKVHLENRKGWQNAQGYEGPRTSNTYEIYPQDIPEIDMFSHLARWLKLYEALIGRPLEPEDQLFPHISANGTIHPQKEMSYDNFTKLLSKFTSGSGLTGWFTTHSFRRGGAQYRFQHARIKWSLNIVRWWGGWAEGESVDTLMKYLLDSLQSYENGHGDALHPVPSGANESFMGEHIEIAPVTAGEVRELKRAVDDKIDSIDQKMDMKLDRIVSKITSTLAPLSPTYISAHWPSHTPVTTTSRPARAIPMVRATRLSSVPYPSMSGLASTVVEPVSSHNGASSIALESGDNDKVSPNSIFSETGREQHTGRKQRPVPIQGVMIPNLKPGPDAWKCARDQWEKGDPAAGLLALKDWPEAWYTGDMRTFTGSKRRERELVVLAYNNSRLGRDDDAFLKEYPQAKKSMRSLLRAIRRDPEIATARNSRNGTPEERQEQDDAFTSNVQG